MGEWPWQAPIKWQITGRADGPGGTLTGLAPRETRAGVKHRYKFAIAACARWETPYIIEWLTYYQILGFDHVFLYCNDDEPDSLFLKVLPFTLGERPFVTFRYWPRQGEQPQMYGDFLRRDAHACEWISFFDIDEFLALPPGQTISQFMANVAEGIDCVMFNWLFFGPNGHETPPSGYVLENFTRRQREIHCLTKFVSRTAAFANSAALDFNQPHWFWHNPFCLAPSIRAANVLGEPMADYFEGFPDQPTRYVNEPERHDKMLAAAMIHHYAFRSQRHFIERAERGLQGAFADQAHWQDIHDSDGFSGYLAAINAMADTRLASFWVDYGKRARLADMSVRPACMLVSRGKTTSQSSTGAGTPGPLADSAVNGQIDGRRKFQTAFEASPWWQVDLGACALITEIRIYNIAGADAPRFRRFSLAVSINGEDWIALCQKLDDQVIGGIDNGPFVWNGPGVAWSRFVRITLLEPNILHLDQVEIYGRFTGSKETGAG